MKANELRIGNYYVDIDNKLSSISGYELHQFTIKENTDNLGVMEYQPIPLTEEWLLKFGFENNKLEANHNDIIYYSRLNNIGIKGMLGMVKVSQCIYVHQLQNLYFALTNKELKQ